MACPGMSPEERDLWRAADAIFARLLDLPSAGRGAALADQGLPTPVGERVARLLAADRCSGGPLDRGWEEGRLVGLEGFFEEAPDPLVGRLVGRFRLLERVGCGGMGAVYRAEGIDVDGATPVAIKLLRWPFLDPCGRERFRREGRILARLRHPNIAACQDGGVAEDGTPYLVMELVMGERIDDYCHRRQLSAGERVELFRQVTRAVAHAHAHRVVHRDIKPANILVEPEGEVKLLDFGIAKLLDDEHGLTGPGDRLLTPEFAAPEQLAGGPVTPATDVYSLGLLLERLLTDAPPLERTLGLGPGAASPALRAPGIDRRLRRILRRALRPEPERRYSTAGELESDLERWLRGEPVAAPHDAVRNCLPRRAQTHGRALSVGGLLVAAGLGGIASSLWQARRPRR
jgi:eukaryotic-like serine/threonine-protein kinase